MQFSVQADGQRHFDLLDSNSNTIGQMDYKGWTNSEAEITFPDAAMVTLGATNVWLTKIQAVRGEEVLYNASFNWGGHTIIEAADHTYTFRKTNFWRNEETLFLENEQPLLQMGHQFIISKLSYRFDIETNDDYPQANDPVLIFTLVYCVNKMLRQGHFTGASVR